MTAETTFAEAGLDSLAAVEARDTLSTRLGTSLPPTILFDSPTPHALAAALIELLLDQPEELVDEPDDSMPTVWVDRNPFEGNDTSADLGSTVALVTSASIYPESTIATNPGWQDEITIVGTIQSMLYLNDWIVLDVVSTLISSHHS